MGGMHWALAVCRTPFEAFYLYYLISSAQRPWRVGDYSLEGENWEREKISSRNLNLSILTHWQVTFSDKCHQNQTQDLRWRHLVECWNWGAGEKKGLRSGKEEILSSWISSGEYPCTETEHKRKDFFWGVAFLSWWSLFQCLIFQNYSQIRVFKKSSYLLFIRVIMKIHFISVKENEHCSNVLSTSFHEEEFGF